MSVDSTDTRLRRPTRITPATLAETPPDLRGVVAQTLADFAPFVPAPTSPPTPPPAPTPARPYKGQHRARLDPETPDLETEDVETPPEDLETRDLSDRVPAQAAPPEPCPFLIGPLAAEPSTTVQPEPVALLGRILHALGLRGPR